MRIIISGGGTGGHITPAVAIAECLTKYHKGCELLFICRADGHENKPISDAGYAMKTLKVRGIERRVTLKNLGNVFLALDAERRARRIIKEFSPDAVIGTGGYVCWPVLHAAAALGVPCAIHESNLVPGLVTRTLAKKCTAILLNLDGTRQYLGEREGIITVGNPIRDKFTAIDRRQARRSLGIRDDEIYIVSFGGSGGSERINDTVASLSEYYRDCDLKIRHTHATGLKYYDAYKDNGSQSTKIKIVPYIDDMPTHLRSADIAICRSGAMTLSELALAKTPAILIPSPNVTDNHQFKNARYFSERRAAILIEENELSPERLFGHIRSLSQNRKKRDGLSEKIGKLASPDAAKRIVRELEKIANQKTD